MNELLDVVTRAYACARSRLQQGRDVPVDETCTVKMGRDSMAVVDGYLRAFGIDDLRVVDGSIIPRVTAGNTWLPASSSARVPEKY